MLTKNGLSLLNPGQQKKGLEKKIQEIDNILFEKENELSLENLTSIILELDIYDLFINENKRIDKISKSIMRASILKVKTHAALVLAKIENKNNTFEEVIKDNVKDYIFVERNINTGDGELLKLSWWINLKGNVVDKRIPRNLTFSYDGKKYIAYNFDSKTVTKVSDVYKSIYEIVQTEDIADEKDNNLQKLLSVKIDANKDGRIYEILDGYGGFCGEEYCLRKKGLQLNFEKQDDKNILASIIDKDEEERNDLQFECLHGSNSYKVKKWGETGTYEFKDGKLQSVNYKNPNWLQRLKARSLNRLIKKRGIQLNNNISIFDEMY